MKFKRFALMVVLAALAATFMACGQAGNGGGSAAMAALPDGDYQWIVSVKPNELMKSQFVEKVKESFPMAEGAFSELTNQAEESGFKLEDIDTISAFSNKEGDTYAFADGKFKPEEAIKGFEKDKGVKMEEMESEGMKYYVAEENDEAIYFAGNTAISTSKENITKVLETVAGKGDKYIDSDAYKKAVKYFDQGQTFSFYAPEMGGQAAFDPSMAQMVFGMYEQDPEKLKALGEAMAAMTGFGAKIKVTDKINGNVAVIFSDNDSAKVLADFYNANKDKMFEMAAMQAEQATAMAGLKYDKEKILALKKVFNFKAEGDSLVIGINLAWNDISFMFEE
jgi:ribosomal protein L10